MIDLLVGDIIECEVVDLGIEGEGVVKYGAFPIFVPFALPGEKVRVRLNYVKKDVAFGDLIEVLSPSNERVKPRCCYFGKCGGCDLQHMSHALQMQTKRQFVERSLSRNGGIDFPVPPVKSLNEWGYRNKLSLPFGVNGEKKIVLGFFEKRTHKVVPLKHCALNGDSAATLISVVTEWANEHGLSVYDEKTGKGLLRHLVARMTNFLSAVVVINGDTLPYASDLAKRLENAFQNFALYVSVNKKNTNVIMTDGVTLIAGQEREQNLGAFSAKVSPCSFLQVNDKIRDAIYDDVASTLADFDGNIVELYSGVGILTAQLAVRLKDAKITSVEIVPEAVEDAKNLMKKLGVDDRVTCELGDAGEFMKSHSEKAGKRAIVLDPPRKGCSQDTIDGIISAGFELVAYVSCNPATLARDIKRLTENGYTLKSVQPYDMFPQTSNVETYAVLEKTAK